MRERLAAWLRRLANWVAPASASSDLSALAARLVRQAERMADGTSGEYKRHWVYAQMRKAHPSVRGRVIGLAIEQAMQELP